MLRVLIIGGSGLLGANWAFRRRDVDEVHITSYKRNIKINGVTSHHLDARNMKALQNLLLDIKPDLVINCSGLTNVNACHHNPSLSHDCNVKIPYFLSKSLTEADIPFIQISSDHLFDGLLPKVNENQKPNPQNIYAAHKLEAEKIVLRNHPNSMILRTTFFGWGPSYRLSFSDKILNDLKNQRQVLMYDDVFFTPLHTSQVIDCAHSLFDKKYCGVINLCSGERISKYDFSVLLSNSFGYDGETIQPIQSFRKINAVKRPLDLSLDDQKIRKTLGIESFSIQDTLDALHETMDLGEEIKTIGRLIPYGRHYIDDKDIAAVSETLRSGALTQGPAILKFEERIAQYTGAKYAVAVSSATAGLHVAYKALGLGEGQSVLTSPITFVSTANAAYFCGGYVRFADIDPLTANIAIDAVKSALDKYSDVHIVTPVLFGGAAEGVPEIAQYAKTRGKHIVEDAAHGLGGHYACGAKIGSCKYSDCTVFSLHPVKSIAAGEGGVITTNNEFIYKTLLRLRSHGINKNDDPFIDIDKAYTDGEPNLWYYEMSTLGYHYRFTDIQASLANSQLDKLNQFVSRRRELAHRYVSWLQGQTYIKRAQSVDINASANHIFVCAIDFDSLGKSRNEIMKQLRNKSIITQVHYVPVVNQPFFKKQGFVAEDFPISQAYYEAALSLPLYFDLNDKDFNYVLKSIEQVLQL
jgi:UDP-4-amino-4,6-dideoxy-N-acetyl-beta-L-altrosamine transaminase